MLLLYLIFIFIFVNDIYCVILISIMVCHFLYGFFQGRYRFLKQFWYLDILLLWRYFVSLLEGVFKPFVCHTTFHSGPWDFIKTNSMCQQQFKRLIDNMFNKHVELSNIRKWIVRNSLNAIFRQTKAVLQELWCIYVLVQQNLLRF